MKLSIVMSGRNDNYGKDFLNRLQESADTLFRYAKDYNLYAELVFVEWNNPEDRTGIEKAIDWHPATIPVRVIHVPKKVHDSIPGSDKLPFLWAYAQNVGIRRARGEFILIMTPDIILSTDMVRCLAKFDFNPDCFYGAIRSDLDHLGWVVRTRGSDEPYMGLHMNACGDFTLMARDRWLEIGGYPEVPFNTYVDGTVLALVAQNGMHQVILKHPIYHRNHDNEEGRPVLDLTKFPLPANQHPNWGFADLEFEESMI